MRRIVIAALSVAVLTGCCSPADASRKHLRLTKEASPTGPLLWRLDEQLIAGIIPVGFFGGKVLCPTGGFCFDFTPGTFPAKVVPTRTGDNFYVRTGANSIALSTTTQVCEDIGNGLGRGCWAALSDYTNDVAGAGGTLSDFSTGDGWSGDQGVDRVGSCGTGPDGSSASVCLYDNAPNYSGLWKKDGAASTTLSTVASVWTKSTGVAAPAFSGGYNFLSTPGTNATNPLAYRHDITFDQDGYITCMVFYKWPADTDNTHKMTLWDDTPAVIATVNTSGETASGWQVMRISPAIAVTGGVHYGHVYVTEGLNYWTEHSDSPSFPYTQNHMTVSGAYYTTTPSAYPNTFNAGMLSHDLCFEPTTNNSTYSDPTNVGSISALVDGSYSANVSAASVWTRVVTSFAGGSSYTPTFWLQPSGVIAGGTPTPIPGSVGGLQFAAPQLARGVIEGDPPLVLGHSGDLKMAVTDSAVLNTIPDGGGKFNIVADFLVDGNDIGFGSPAVNQVLFDFDTSDGKYQVYGGNQTVLEAIVRGVDPGTSGLSINIGNLDPDGVLRAQLYYTGSSTTLAAWVNGCSVNTATVNAVTGVVHSPTAATIGSKTDGTKQTQRRVARWSRGDLTNRADPFRAEFLVLGDSLMSEYPGNHTAVCKHVYTAAESIVRDGTVSFAYPGETVPQQKARYDASVQKGQSYVKGVLAQDGVNDLSTPHTDVQIITDKQSEVTDLNTNNSGALIFLMPLWPTKSTLSGTQYTYWQNINQAITGGGGTPITGSNLVRMHPGSTLASSYWPFINDGSDNLASWTDAGDGRHQLDNGSLYMGAVIRAYEQAHALLLGGAAPTCISVSPSHAAVGATVTVNGTGLSSIIGAGFNGTGIYTGVPISDTQITVKVPTGATTGTLQIATPLGTASCGTFTIP